MIYKLLCCLLCLSAVAVAESLPPMPPMAQADSNGGARSGRVVFVGSTGNAISNGNLLQAAINGAQPGDTLALEIVTYQAAEGFYLKSKRAITLQSANACTLPPVGARINGPQYAGLLPRIIATNANASAFDFWMKHAPDTVSACSDIKVIGLELTSATNTTQIVKIGGGVWPRSPDEQPAGIIVERCYVHGGPTASVRRGLVFNGSNLSLIDSWVSDIHDAVDAQAVCGWNGGGPFKIHNNYLAASGENVMFGGADATIPGLVPADGEICHNTFEKPFTWRVGHPQYAGIHWRIKNHLEFKNAERFIVHDNLMLNSWVDAQVGYSIDLTPRNQDGANPWARVTDIDLYSNTIRHCGAGFDVLGTDNEHHSGILARIRVRDCLLEDIKTSYGGYGAAFVFASGSTDFTIERVTMTDHDNLVIACDGAQNIRTTITGCRFTHGGAGIKGSGTEGNECFARYFPGVVFSGNVLIGFPQRLYSDFPNNTFQ